MNPISFIVAAWVFFGLELGLKDALALGSTDIAPSFVVVLLVIISLMASKTAAISGALALGVVMDLTHPWPAADSTGAIVTVGPYALGALLASYTIVTLRALVIKRNPITLLLLGAVAVFLMHIVFIAIMTARSWYDPAIEFQPMAELLRRLGVAVYTGALAFALGPLLLFFTPLFGFTQTDARMRWKRA